MLSSLEGGAQASAGDEDIDEPDAPKGIQLLTQYSSLHTCTHTIQ